MSDTRILILEAALLAIKREITERSDVTDGREGRQIANQAMELETLLVPIIDAALAKNPNPSGHVLAEASTGESPSLKVGASGSVGLGPECSCASPNGALHDVACPRYDGT